EGVDLHLPAGAERLQAQPAPGGGVVRQGPGAVDGGHRPRVVGERDQAAGLGPLPRAVGVEDGLVVAWTVAGAPRTESRISARWTVWSTIAPPPARSTSVNQSRAVGSLPLLVPV